MREFVTRTCIFLEFVGAIPLFALLIWVSPDRYAKALGESGDTMRARIAQYRGGAL